MTKERLFKKEYAKELLAIAKDDLKGAEVLAAANLQRQEMALFHIQQAVEKALKALLCWLGIPVPLVHSLSIIQDRIPRKYQVPFADSLEDLTQFATIRRYEEGIALFTAEEISSALELGHKITEWVAEQIK